IKFYDKALSTTSDYEECSCPDDVILDQSNSSFKFMHRSYCFSSTAQCVSISLNLFGLLIALGSRRIKQCCIHTSLSLSLMGHQHLSS
ncbi:hypothetical protein PMAYCL1PPCAC_10226, partial [Pristionchus mayeri]